MITLDSEASERLGRYLNEMRISMKDSNPADVAEIEQDIRDHVDAELADRPSPISLDQLNEVLQRLGSPHQWAADEALASTREKSHRATSTNDRLSYASAGTMLAFLFVPPFLLVSWLLARWTLARIEEHAEPLGARRWLLYPPIIIVIVPIAVIGLLWPFAPVGALAGSIERNPAVLAGSTAATLDAITVGLGGVGIYWILLGAALAFGERFVRFLFYPFAGAFRRRHGWMLSGVGAALAAAAFTTLVFLGRR